MLFRTFMAGALVAAIGVGNAAAAVSQKYTDWANGPVRHLMTEKDQKDWKNVKNDQQAEAFVNLFWARRDPTPSTPANEFRDEFESRVKFADEHFGSGKTPGSMTDRGKALILLGAPERRTTSAARGSANIQTPGSTPTSIDAMAATPAPSSAPTERWFYEKSRLPAFAPLKEFEVAFIDQHSSNNWKLGSTGPINMKKLYDDAVNFYITAPDLKEAPTFAAGAAPVAASVPAASAAVRSDFSAQEVKAAYASYKATGKSPVKTAYLTWSEAITADGDYFVPVQIYLPASAGVAAGQNMTMFAALEKSDGTLAAVVEQPVTTTSSKNDVFTDASLQVDPGTYVAYVGLASGDTPVVMAKGEMNLKGIRKDTASVSPLIISNNIFALDKAQAPTDPFAFGGLKVVPKGDRTFSTAEELWYFYEMINPSLDDSGAPKVQVQVEVETMVNGASKKRRAPLAEVNPEAVKGVANHYMVGNSIPLSGFTPGDYTIRLKVIDTVAKQTYNLEQNFRIVQ